MAATLQYQQHNSDVTTAMSRDPSRDLPRDVMTANISIDLAFNDSLLQPSLYDVTDTSRPPDAWTMTSSLMTSCAADDSGVSLSQSLNNDDEWILGISPGNPSYDVIAAEHVTTETHRSAAGNPLYDVNVRVKAETPVERRTGLGIPAGNPPDDVSSWRFTDEQIVCICVSLQQKRDFDKLDEFLSTLAVQPDLAGQITQSSRETCDDNAFPATSLRFRVDARTCAVQSDVVDAVLSSVAHVAFHRGRYQQLFDVLRSHPFSQVHHARLQQLWYDGYYAAETEVRRRTLGAVDKYRIRRKHQLPATIWDGEETVYCFKVWKHQVFLCSHQ